MWGIMVIVIRNGYGDPNSYSGQGGLHFILGTVCIQQFSLHLLVNSRVDWLFKICMTTGLGEGKLWIQTC